MTISVTLEGPHDAHERLQALAARLAGEDYKVSGLHIRQTHFAGKPDRCIVKVELEPKEKPA